MTGESTPKRKKPDDQVFAGTINADAALRVKVTATAEDNTIARVVRLVEEAQESKAPTERFIDRFSRWYTPGILIVGALVAVVPPLLGINRPYMPAAASRSDVALPRQWPPSGSQLAGHLPGHVSA